MNTKYREIAAFVRDLIQRNEIPPGAAIPSTAMLARRFAVSPMTVRHAVDVLAAEGVVERFQGRGVYVTSRTEEGHEMQDSHRKVEVPLWAVLYAIRYGMGRLTYANSDAARLAKEHWEKFDESTQQQIRRDAKEMISRDPMRMYARDEWAWLWPEDGQ